MAHELLAVPSSGLKIIDAICDHKILTQQIERETTWVFYLSLVRMVGYEYSSSEYREL